MRKPMVRTALAGLIGAALALAPVALEAQTTGRATGRARSSGTGIADRIGTGRGISGVITGSSITARGRGLTSTWPHTSARIIRSSTHSIGVANSPFGTIQHCAGVSVVTASSIWGASIRDCGRRIKTSHSVTGIFPVAVPIYVPAPYVYSDATLLAGGMPAFITPAPQAPAPAPAVARTMVFDTSRPYTLIWPPSRYGVPIAVYTAGGAAIYYVEHPPARKKSEPVVQSGAKAQPSACARLTVILASGDGWWKTLWLPALGASSVEALRVALDDQLADESLTIVDATGTRVDMPERSKVRTVMVDRCPPDSGR